MHWIIRLNRTLLLRLSRKIAVLLLLISAAGLCQNLIAQELSLEPHLYMGIAGLGLYAVAELTERAELEWFEEAAWSGSNRWAYHAGYDRISTVTSLANLALLFLLPDYQSTDSLLATGLGYVEAGLLAVASKDLLKAIFRRPRPYLFDPDQELNAELREEAYQSFPSGHTTIACMTAAFTTAVYNRQEHPDSHKALVTASTWGLAGLTGFLRVRSGAHYWGDVAAGAILGSVIGFSVPYLLGL